MEYENVSNAGTSKPSIEPILITLDGSSKVAFLVSNPFSCWVKKNKLLVFKFITLSHPASEKASKGSAQAAPALLIKKSIPSSFSLICSAKLLTPSNVLRSHPRAIHSPLYFLESSSAFDMSGPTFRAVI